jgi:transposase
LANPEHIRNFPGRKTDVKDATWIAELLAHDLIRSSFVPPLPIQQIRDLTRLRKQSIRGIAQQTQRLQKVLEDANLKLTGLISDLLGKSGRAILKALAQGENDPEKLADLLEGRLKSKRAQVVEALRGRVTKHHRFLLNFHLTQIEGIEVGVRELEARLGESLLPFQSAIGLLKTIPGVSDITAQIIVAEIGVDMSRFPDVGHLISWGGLCSQLNESAGKRKSTRLKKGNSALKEALIQAAWAASRVKNTYLQAQFLRLRSRRGPKKAVGAVAASILTAVYYMLKEGTTYQDLGADYFDRRNKEKLTNHHIRKLRELGLEVTIRPAA